MSKELNISQNLTSLKSNYWLNTLLLNDKFSYQRDLLLELTNNQGIMTRPTWTLMHKLDIYKGCPKMDDLTIAENLEKTFNQYSKQCTFRIA